MYKGAWLHFHMNTKVMSLLPDLSSLYRGGGKQLGGKNHKDKHFYDNLICRAGRNRPQFEAVMESFLGQAPEHFGTLR